MTITIDLPPDLEAAVRAKAEQRGQQVGDYLVSLAEQDVRPNGTPALRRSLAELLAGRIGVIDSSEVMGGAKSHLSEDRGSFSAYLEGKRSDGRL